jgi:beta-glucuronidase
MGISQVKLQGEAILMRKRTSLNGVWGWVADEYDQIIRGLHMGFVRKNPEKRHVDTMWPMALKKMRIPSSWNMEVSELFHYHGTVVFQREFAYGAVKPGRKVRICFEASFYHTEVWINGELAGTHDGGFTPFTFDLTPHLKRKNVLHVLVDSARKDDRVPAPLTDWFNYGGISREVFLEESDADCIADFFIRYHDGNIHCDIETEGKERGVAKVEIPELGLCAAVDIINRKGRFCIPMKKVSETKTGSGPLPSPDLTPFSSLTAISLWSPANPKLYKVTVTYANDSVADRVGFRTVEVRDRKILLNGEEVKLKGVCVHEEAEPKGRALNNADRKRIFDLAEEMRANFIRLAHYPHAREMAQEADRRGMLLWEEIPVYWFIQFENPPTAANAAAQLSELVRRDRNRASVIMWSVANETPEYKPNRTEFISGLVKLAKELDGTRPVTAAIFAKVDKENGRITVEDPLGASLDILGLNYYGGWYGGTFDDLRNLVNERYPDKPIIISEFGADARKGFRGTKKFTEDYQRRLYQHVLAAIKSNPFVKGVTPWILFDFRSPNRMNIYQDDFNRKGLVDADRKSKKLVFETYRKWRF